MFLILISSKTIIAPIFLDTSSSPIIFWLAGVGLVVLAIVAVFLCMFCCRKKDFFKQRRKRFFSRNSREKFLSHKYENNQNKKKSEENHLPHHAYEAVSVKNRTPPQQQPESKDAVTKIRNQNQCEIDVSISDV